MTRSDEDDAEELGQWLPGIANLLRISQHPEKNWLQAQLEMAKCGVELRKKHRAVRLLADDMETRLVADAGLVRLTALCSTSAAFEAAWSKAQLLKDAVLALQDTNPDMFQLISDIDFGLVFQIEREGTVLKDMCSLHAKKLYDCAVELMQQAAQKTKQLECVGTEHSWRHGLTEDTPLATVLAQGKVRLADLKGQALREHLEKINKAGCRVWQQLEVFRAFKGLRR